MSILSINFVARWNYFLVGFSHVSHPSILSGLLDSNKFQKVSCFALILCKLIVNTFMNVDSSLCL
jgi:hypothetical protein